MNQKTTLPGTRLGLLVALDLARWRPPTSIAWAFGTIVATEPDLIDPKNLRCWETEFSARDKATETAALIQR
jgi:hypothetical protein